MKADDPELEPVETDILSAEVNKDIAEGNGAKHFERELDEIHSQQGSAHAPDPDVAARLHRFCLELRKGLTDTLRGTGLRCGYVMPDGRGEGFSIRFFDTAGRLFDVEYAFDDAMRLETEGMGRAMMDEIARRVLNARAAYFVRMQ